MLGILADQKMRERPRVDYFGQEVPSSPIPGLFHSRSGAPLFVLSVATTGPALVVKPPPIGSKRNRVALAPGLQLDHLFSNNTSKIVLNIRN